MLSMTRVGGCLAVGTRGYGVLLFTAAAIAAAARRHCGAGGDARAFE